MAIPIDTPATSERPSWTSGGVLAIAGGLLTGVTTVLIFPQPVRLGATLIELTIGPLMTVSIGLWLIVSPHRRQLAGILMGIGLAALAPDIPLGVEVFRAHSSPLGRAEFGFLAAGACLILLGGVVAGRTGRRVARG